MPRKNRFAALSPTPENHFWLVSRCAIFRVIHVCADIAERNGNPSDVYLDRFAFLREWFEEMRPFLPDHLDWTETFRWWNREVRDWEARHFRAATPPLCCLAADRPEDASDRHVLMLAGLGEESVGFGSLCAALQDPLPSRRLSYGLLLALFPDDGEEAVRRCVTQGLLLLENRDQPRAEWTLRVPLLLWDTLRKGVLPTLGAAMQFHAQAEFPDLDALLLPCDLRAQVGRLPDLLAHNVLGGVAVRGMAHSGRRTLLGAVAKKLKRDVLTFKHVADDAENAEQFALLGALCLLTQAFPIIACEPAAGEQVTVPSLTGYEGAVGFVLPREGGISGSAAERAVTLVLPAPSVEERRTLWRSQLRVPTERNAATDPTLPRLPLGAIARMAQTATAYAALEGHSTLCARDVLHASRALDRQILDTLAQRLAWDETVPPEQRWERLIVTPKTRAELRDLEHRCRYRERLAGAVNSRMRGTINCGVRVLFVGGSGTGKTLAAQTVAGVLEKDIYRVDLAGIVNKYIGETEKNLHRLLNSAEELDIILLFDEGDSLMAGRTEVKSSNDRYANQETNYLLQRLENYEGIVFVTTNAGSRVDTAFERRFDAVIGFHAPDGDERRDIWKLHLPDAHAISENVLTEASDLCKMTGGQIRNAALHAVLLSLTDGRNGSPDAADLHIAIRREYRKMGAACPLEGTALAASARSRKETE